MVEITCEDKDDGRKETASLAPAVTTDAEERISIPLRRISSGQQWGEMLDSKWIAQHAKVKPLQTVHIEWLARLMSFGGWVSVREDRLMRQRTWAQTLKKLVSSLIQCITKIFNLTVDWKVDIHTPPFYEMRTVVRELLKSAVRLDSIVEFECCVERMLSSKEGEGSGTGATKHRASKGQTRRHKNRSPYPKKEGDVDVAACQCVEWRMTRTSSIHDAVTDVRTDWINKMKCVNRLIELGLAERQGEYVDHDLVCRDEEDKPDVIATRHTLCDAAKQCHVFVAPERVAIRQQEELASEIERLQVFIRNAPALYLQCPRRACRGQTQRPKPSWSERDWLVQLRMPPTCPSCESDGVASRLESVYPSPKECSTMTLNNILLPLKEAMDERAQCIQDIRKLGPCPGRPLYGYGTQVGVQIND